jgi:hypothetical protein
MRFRRTVYGTVADREFGLSSPATSEGPDAKPAIAVKAKAAKQRKWNAEPHELADLPIPKLHAPALKKWHVDLVAKGLSKAAANRTLTALKAALNMALPDRKASPIVAQRTWRR